MGTGTGPAMGMGPEGRSSRTSGRSAGSPAPRGEKDWCSRIDNRAHVMLRSLTTSGSSWLYIDWNSARYFISASLWFAAVQPAVFLPLTTRSTSDPLAHTWRAFRVSALNSGNFKSTNTVNWSNSNARRILFTRALKTSRCKALRRWNRIISG